MAPPPHPAKPAAAAKPKAKPEVKDYTYRGQMDLEAFLTAYKEAFSRDGRYTVAREPDLRQFLGFLTKDPKLTDLRWMAYILATVYWEDAPLTRYTAKTKAGKEITRRAWLTKWSPAEETGLGKGRGYEKAVKVEKLPDGGARVTEQDGDQWTVRANGTYSPTTNKTDLGSNPTRATPVKVYADAAGDEHLYYGRGYTQLTWWCNYAANGAKINRGLDLLFNPDLALEPQISYDVLSDALRTGSGFANGHKLGDYIHGATTHYTAARAMINGSDHAGDIARYAEKFEAILFKARKT